MVIWLTGLSGSGKTTIAKELSTSFTKNSISNEILDGDIYRAILSPKDGYSDQEREIFRQKVIFIAELLVRNDIVCIIPLLSSIQKTRALARNKFKNFIEVYIKCPLDICEIRDPKGLYKQVRKGEINNFVGIDLPYEEPINPEIIIQSDKLSASKASERIMDYTINNFSYLFS